MNSDPRGKLAEFLEPGSNCPLDLEESLSYFSEPFNIEIEWLVERFLTTFNIQADRYFTFIKTNQRAVRDLRVRDLAEALEAGMWLKSPCQSCGYGLRASTNCCPECGSSIENQNSKIKNK